MSKLPRSDDRSGPTTHGGKSFYLQFLGFARAYSRDIFISKAQRRRIASILRQAFRVLVKGKKRSLGALGRGASVAATLAVMGVGTVGFSGPALAGDYATGGGIINPPSGYATAIGEGATTTGEFATAIGANSNAFGHTATATGQFANAIGAYATATGQYANATGNYATATGQAAVANGANATATGARSNATGN